MTLRPRHLLTAIAFVALLPGTASAATGGDRPAPASGGHDTTRPWIMHQVAEEVAAAPVGRLQPRTAVAPIRSQAASPTATSPTLKREVMGFVRASMLGDPSVGFGTWNFSLLSDVAYFGIRVNPDVDARTHPHISTGLRQTKFGIAFEDALSLYLRAAEMPGIRVRGVAMHIGSQITALEPHRAAATKVLELVDGLAAEGIRLKHVDLGGGLGIRYRDETPVALADYAAMVRDLFRGRGESVLFEPGRRLTANAGLLLTRVMYLKPGAERSFAVVDAAMNDLLRPALYDAWHDVRPIRARPERASRWQIVGPVCESADFLARDRELALEEGDLLAILSAGAYAMSMSSNYNSRPRAAEILVDGNAMHLAARRESIEELFARESRLP